MGIFSRSESAVLEPVFAAGPTEAVKPFETMAASVETAAYETAGATEPCSFGDAANDADDDFDDGETALIDLPRAASSVRPVGEAL